MDAKIEKYYTLAALEYNNNIVEEHIHLVKESIVNLHAWKGKLDLINIVMIGLSEDIPIHEEKYELHKLLGALLSQIYL